MSPIAKRLRDVIDLLEAAVADEDCKLVEEALDELRELAEELS
ncbi:hypothetical protein Pogu_1181 [Pyrobaculum oguniense TE7]|uniref:Uncharacterized protein n=1 Tax=Pyrobaculum oguniense (strain DSM 13380 / JCM 10595 / TE7) TaxID=698757 RepID=H6Q8Q3_PYROT|nr:hypothetical protein Pogu_1181 [Pyrobaculum oguniense TE7]